MVVGGGGGGGGALALIASPLDPPLVLAMFALQFMQKHDNVAVVKKFMSKYNSTTILTVEFTEYRLQILNVFAQELCNSKPS